jgi:hypothetical protein
LFSETGSASNAVCLPRDPLWGKYDDTVTSHATMYGAEFYTYNKDNLLLGEHIHHHDVQCAVCRSLSDSTAVMIPARNLCYPGWTMAYSGYLMAGYHLHAAASEYVCMDAHPEPEPNTQQSEVGKFFYFVEGICGSLPCLPYVNGREFTCVVCTK